MPCRRVHALTVLLCVLAALGLSYEATTSSEPESHHAVATPVENPPPRPPEIENLRYQRPLPDGALELPPHLRYPDAKTVSMGMPLAPERAEPRKPVTPEEERRILTYDRATGEVYEETIESAGKLLGPRYTERGIGLHELLEDPEGVAKNFSSWEYVANPSLGDYPKRVKLVMWFRDFDGIIVSGECSGTLIDPMHVITAAHCIWSHQIDDHDIADFALAMEVIPGYAAGQRPFGDAEFSQLHVWTLWSDDHDYDHDIGIIDLDRPIGALTGWWGYGLNSDCGFYESQLWRHAGWPAEDPFDGEFLYHNYGDYDDCENYGFDYRMSWDGPSWGGSSGSGGLKTANGAIYTVLSGSDRLTRTEHVRLSSTKFDQVGQMILEDKPAGLDLIAMDVNSDDDVVSGFRLSTFDFLVLNYSQGTMSDSWPFDMYLSTDRIIDTGDILLSSAAFNYAFGDNGRVRVTVDPAPLIPADTPSGSYYLGVLLTHTDANNANNASNDQATHRITIDCPPTTTPTLLAPFNGITCLPTSYTFSWQPVAPLADYQIRVTTTCDTGDAVDVASTSYTWSGLQPATTYRWQVRSKSQCGAWSHWSPCWVFTTESNPSVVSSVVAPVEGAHCQGSSVALEWTPIPGAETYDVQYSPDWCYEGPIVTGITGPAHTLDDLLPSTIYYWRVRAQTVCGQTTNWSSVPGFCYTFKTAPTSIDPPVRMGPWDGTSCGAATTDLTWNHAEDWDHYEVQIGTSCGTGPIYTPTANGYSPSGLVSGETYYWRVRTFHECGLVSDWTDCWSFSLDLEPPTNPENLWSNTHTVGVWSNDPTVDTQWDWGYDNCTGSWPQYATLWDNSPTTQPTEPTTSGEMTLETSPPLEDGQNHWFHVRTADYAGNLALDTLHLGPFWIDTTDPDAPEFEYATLDPGETTGPTALVFDWSPVLEKQSGVVGYSWSVNSSPTVPPTLDDVVDLTATTLTLEVEQEVDYWFFVRAVDQAGNGGEPMTLGPFTVDHDRVGVFVFTPSRGDVLTEGDVFRVTWDYYDDGAAYPTSGQLAYSLDAGQSYTVIGNLNTALVQQKYWDWTVPIAGSGEAVVRVSLFDQFGRPVSARSERFTMVQVTGVEEPPTLPADRFALHPNQPNPFNPQTTIAYTLPHATHVRLRVYDAAGRLVRTLVDGPKEGPATHRVVWDGRDDRGLTVSSGVYRCSLETAEYQQSRSMVLVK